MQNVHIIRLDFYWTTKIDAIQDLNHDDQKIMEFLTQ